MATAITFNGSPYSVPSYGDSNWAQGAGNLSSYLVAIAAGTLQTTGGNFTLSADVNFGVSFGVFAKYFTSVSASPATAGFLRLAIGDTIDWGTANNALAVNGTDLQWNGSKILTVGNAPGAVTEKREVYIAGTALKNYTGSLTVINMVGSYLTNGVNMNVFVNGLCQDVTYDYTETSTTAITFGSSLNTGDRVSLRWVTY
jgi:hypothetical protein